MEPSISKFRLPAAITGPVDLGRAERELEALDIYMRQSAIRQPNPAQTLPHLSKNLEELAGLNKWDLRIAAIRAKAQQELERVKRSAPYVHLGLAADPSAAFTQKIVAWFREKVDPELLLSVGLQPTIAAGCTLRTANRQFDFSVRSAFINNRQFLLELLGAKK